MTVDEAEKGRARAVTAFIQAKEHRQEAMRKADVDTIGAYTAAKIALHEAEDALAAARSAATPDHPMHGKRVFRMEEVYHSKYSFRPSGEKRVDGVVTTYRPGDPKPKWGYPKIGDALVLPLLKSGQPSKRPLMFEDQKPWLLADDAALAT